MNRLLIVVLFALAVNPVECGGLADSLLLRLDRELDKVDHYVNLKEAQIAELKRQLNEEEPDTPERIHLMGSIAEAYKLYHYDSAFFYTRLLNELAHRNHSDEMIAISKIDLTFIFISSGMFKEASDTLLSIDIKRLPEEVRLPYYRVATLYYFGLADLQDAYFHSIYENLAGQYVDSVLELTESGSYDHLYFRGLRYVRDGNFRAGMADLSELRRVVDLTVHQRAIVSSTMSDIYINQGNDTKAIELLAEASICDIMTATRETAAILNLANILFRNDDIERAYTYTRRALEDANIYGARHRKIQVGRILPIIEEEKIKIVESQKRLLLLYAVFSTLLVLVIVVSVVVIQRQLAKIKKADWALHLANDSLSFTNKKLVESNRIKDEYLGYYFNVISNYIEKIENLKTSLEKSLENDKYDTARYIAASINPKKERTKLYKGFDSVFLNLFPGFIEDFNALFKEEERIQPDENELLNTNLRIFALIRLGINENDKIAGILDLSVNTIYTYKTKIRNKSIVPNEEFEKRIMEISFF